MKKIRVGVIGVGYLGTFHAQKYAEMEEVDLVGVVDINRRQTEKVAAKLSTIPYQDYRDLMGKVDAVSIVVPTPAHFAISKDFLENDVDVLIEKPMTTTTEEADELIRIAASRSVIIQVGHLERFNPAVIALKDFVKKPMFIESDRLSIYKERGTDVSVVLDLMIHDIDIVLSFVKSEVKSIHAAGIPVISEHVDIANARLEFENGCVANMTASRISTRDERKIRLFQRDAYLSVDFANHEATVVSQDGDSEGGLIPGMGIKQFSFSKGDALNDELKAFVKAVIHRETPEVTGRVGRDALRIALEIMGQIRETSSRFLAS
ncbi:Gfo/Idh/MocA family oxidoreductase [Thermodesulfobacteriota bacterium]